jgi:parvulin-like peptidyl-prolyl isomerase
VRTRTRSLLAAIVMMLLGAYAAIGQTSKTPAPPTQPASEAVAKVGARSVPRDILDQRAAMAAAEFRKRNGTDIPDDLKLMFQRQILESLIHFELLVLDAQRRGMSATVEQAEEQLKKDTYFNPGGQFDANRFAAVKAANSPAYQSAIAEIRLRLAGQQLLLQLEREATPTDAALREMVGNQLSHLSLDYLALATAEFDGHYPEPRERDILDYYRTHAADFRRPERGEISVIFVDKPSLPESLRSIPKAVQAWEARMRQRADSGLAAIRAGSSFENVGTALGGIHSRVEVERDNFPGYWLGTKEMNAALFQLKPESVLPQPVPTNPGCMLVRLDSRTDARTASLSEVSPDIRRTLRQDARLHHEDRELAAIYATKGDSLRGPAVRVRYATVDSLATDPGEPSDADLDRYYRGHLADYSSFDARTGAIRSIPLADVRGDIRVRWRHDRRAEVARATAEGIARAWGENRRDAALEKSATLLRDVGPLPVLADVDTGLAGALVSDSVGASGAVKHVGMAPYPRGYVVFHVYDTQANYKPTVEQARGPLRELNRRLQLDRDMAGARKLFDQDPSRWAEGNVLHFSRIIVPIREAKDVPLTRAEVERYHRDHFDQYSAPEMVEARHILISPTGPGAAADQIAHNRADSLLKVIRAGEDFGAVARVVSDDPATAPSGGSLGLFARGAMLPEFEKVAFALKPGEVSEPVKTEVGWHLIKVLDHLPLYAQPLGWVYANVGFDLAQLKADTLAQRTADSLFKHVHTPAEAEAAGKRMGLVIEHNTHVIGNRIAAPDVKPYLTALENVKPHHLYPGPYVLRGLGAVITWVDSITPPQPPDWGRAQVRVLAAYRASASARAAQAKLEEMDSLSTAGWSFDSLGTMWGGLVHVADAVPSAGIRELRDSRAMLDSLANGAHGGPALSTGQVSGWRLLPGNYVKVRMLEKKPPDPAMLSQRLDAERRAAVDRALRPKFDEMSKRYGVRILDPKLAEVALPEPPPGPSPSR